MKYKNILILGATGATGRWLVQMATERGHQVTALVRSKENIEERDGLEIVQGDVLDAATLEHVMEGKDAVLSCLGISRKSASNPWSPLLSSSDFSATSAQSIVVAMKKHGVERLIAISAAGVGDSKANVDPITRLLFRKSNLSITLQDSENMEEVYTDSGLDSLAVRPVRLVDGAPANRARIVERCGISSKISRSDVAGWMLDALERPEPFTSRSEMIAWK